MLRAKASGTTAASALVDKAAARLAAAGVEPSRLDAQVLLAEAAHCDRVALLAGSIEVMPRVAARFDALITRRAAHEPIAYILGRREFYSLEFEVTPDVLIPRPHTETVIDAALEYIAAKPHSRVLDIGTGPGAIAISVAANAADASLVATDVSAAALEVARRNAARYRVAERITFVRADVFVPLDNGAALGTFDLVISNPPYIVDDEVAHLDADIRDFEPHLALRGGADGLDFFRRIANNAKAHLHENGLLVLEVGAGQDTAVAEILNKAGMHPVRVINDLDGIARVITARP
jgi:release factor glutamine methyltransferase